ncbi:unnamed protein product, partial [marine sediment metagenome]
YQTHFQFKIPKKALAGKVTITAIGKTKVKIKRKGSPKISVGKRAVCIKSR